MCVIVICKNKKLTKEYFDKCWTSNSDGFGMAWANNSQVNFVKGIMDKVDAKKFYYSGSFSFPHVLHFRISSIGGVCPELTHPFPLGWDNTILEGSTNKGVLFQNGTCRVSLEHIINLALLKGIHIPEGKWSDTRALAVLIDKLGENILNVLNKPGKIALLLPKKLIIHGNFSEKKGYLFSNMRWDISKWIVNYHNKGGIYGTYGIYSY